MKHAEVDYTVIGHLRVGIGEPCANYLEKNVLPTNLTPSLQGSCFTATVY
ncbi:MAG: hypothetical protein ACRC46_07940 [Thermoguttaceae bacterium]